MKTNTKIALAVAAGAAALLLKKKQPVSGVGAIHYTIKGKVLDYKYRNTSLYGNNSYWVVLETKQGTGKYIVWAYTAPNSQLGYTISNMVGKTVEFDVTQKRNGDVVLNSTTGGYDFKGDKVKK